jgi:hypothetical protein
MAVRPVLSFSPCRLPSELLAAFRDLPIHPALRVVGWQVRGSLLPGKRSPRATTDQRLTPHGSATNFGPIAPRDRVKLGLPYFPKRELRAEQSHRLLQCAFPPRHRFAESSERTFQGTVGVARRDMYRTNRRLVLCSSPIEEFPGLRSPPTLPTRHAACRSCHPLRIRRRRPQGKGRAVGPSPTVLAWPIGR